MAMNRLLVMLRRKTVLVDWNQTDKPFDNTVCLHQLFEQSGSTSILMLLQRERSVISQCLTRNLNARADRLALTLQALGAKPDSLIGLYIERSIDMVVGLLAILKSGAAYVPLDPTYPQDRIALMVADSQASILLTHSSLINQMPVNDAARCMCRSAIIGYG